MPCIGLRIDEHEKIPKAEQMDEDNFKMMHTLKEFTHVRTLIVEIR